MYAKLFSRITESSLMEQPVPTRYVFLALLAIADPKGHVIGTDIALARRINIPLNSFQEAVRNLMEPDPDSNSTSEDGRRLVPSDCGRGYRLVNYLAYRNARDEDHRREYMRNLMAEKRARDKAADTVLAPVSSVSTRKRSLAQAEAEADAEAKADNVGQNRSALSAAGAAPASQSDSEWLAGLKADPAYRGIDVDREHSKMMRWCRENRKQPSRRRFINWLNRVDRPMGNPANTSTQQQPFTTDSNFVPR